VILGSDGGGAAVERIATFATQNKCNAAATASVRVKSGSTTKQTGDARLITLCVSVEDGTLTESKSSGDVVGLPPFIFTQSRIALSQSNTGAQIDIKPTPQPAARIADMKACRRDNNWDNVPTMIVDDRTGMTFNRSTFGHHFAQVRTTAAGDVKLGVRPMPSVAANKFMDTRDTSVTRLAMAGRTLYQIAAITGHTYQSIQRILRHYLALNRDMADAAIDGLVAWMDREGIEL